MTMQLADRLAAHYPAHLEGQLNAHLQALAAWPEGEVMAIFSGSPKIRFLDDSPYPFVANPLFKVWAPLTALPDSWVVIRPGERPKLLYYQPDDYWHTPPADPAGYWVDAFDIHILREPDDARRLIANELSSVAFLGEETRLADAWGFGAVNPPAILNRLHYGRARKSEYELIHMREASALGAAAHRAAEQAFRSGASEYHIHQAYLAACAHTDEELPYHNIIALNEHGAVLHYGHFDREAPAQPHSFLIDAGAQSAGYASDITRTYSASGDEFADLVQAMDAIQLKLVAGMQSGADYRDLHLLTHRLIAGLLVDFKLVKVSADAAVEMRLTTPFYPHGLGHLIGLQVHDVGGHQADPGGGIIEQPEGHPYLRLTRVLEPGFAVTVEPGLYFIEPLLRELAKSDRSRHVHWDRVDGFRRYGGIRIEDDVVVRDQGPPENLTRDAFAALD